METKYLDTEKDWQKSVQVEFTEEEIGLEEFKLIGELKKELILPGFRKGRVPIKLLKARFGDRIKAEITENLSKNALEEILESEGREPITTPTLDSLVFEKEGPLSFVVNFSVKPEISLENYKGFKAKKKVNKITDENIEDVLRKLQEQHVDYIDAGDREAIFTDLVAVEELRVDAEGNPFEGAEPQESSINLGADNLPEEVSNGIRGKKVGETAMVTLKSTAPADKEDEAEEAAEVREFHFRYVVKEIKEQKLPVLDDEFVKDLGEYESIEHLKKKIREDLEAESNRRGEMELKEALVGQLIENNPFEVPEPMKDFYLDRMIEKEKYTFRMYGGADKDFPEEASREKLGKAAEKTVKWDLLRDALTRKESLDVSDEEIEADIKKYADMNGVAPARIKLDLEKKDSYNSFVDNIREQKILDYLVSVSEIKEG